MPHFPGSGILSRGAITTQRFGTATSTIWAARRYCAEDGCNIAVGEANGAQLRAQPTRFWAVIRVMLIAFTQRRSRSHKSKSASRWADDVVALGCGHRGMSLSWCRQRPRASVQTTSYPRHREGMLHYRRAAAAYGIRRHAAHSLQSKESRRRGARSHAAVEATISQMESPDFERRTRLHLACGSPCARLQTQVLDAHDSKFESQTRTTPNSGPSSQPQLRGN